MSAYPPRLPLAPRAPEFCLMGIPVDQIALMEPIDGFPNYFISPDGPVYHQRQSDNMFTAVKIRQTARGRLYVRLYDAAGKRHQLGLKKLLIQAFSIKEPPDDQTQSSVSDGS